MRRLAVLVALGLAVAVPAAAQTEPARPPVTATSDHCVGGLPVVDYRVTNQWSSSVSVKAWWVADASVYGVAGTHGIGPSQMQRPGRFGLPFAGRITTNASWAIPTVDCNGHPNDHHS